MYNTQLFAQRGNDAANEWLNDNPIVLGLIFLAIGAALVISGVYELQRGVTRGKYGEEISGGLGKFTSIVRVVAGVGCCLFAVYKMVAG